MSVGVDFDFVRWLAMRRGAMEQQAREGAAYAFTGERSFRRALALARPVTIAIEATSRLWRDSARSDLQAAAVKATDTASTPALNRVLDAANAAGAKLRVRVPIVFGIAGGELVAKMPPICVLGTDDTPHLVADLSRTVLLDDAELVAAAGHEFGHIQNGHIFYSTGLHYLSHAAAFYVRWIIKPATIALQAWSRRAEVTCDRAALIACRDLDKALSMIVKTTVGAGKPDFDVAEFLRTAPEKAGMVGKYGELFRSHPTIAKRIAALRLFASSALYSSICNEDPTGKLSMPDVDHQVGELISVL